MSPGEDRHNSSGLHGFLQHLLYNWTLSKKFKFSKIKHGLYIKPFY